MTDKRTEIRREVHTLIADLIRWNLSNSSTDAPFLDLGDRYGFETVMAEAERQADYHDRRGVA